MLYFAVLCNYDATLIAERGAFSFPLDKSAGGGEESKKSQWTDMELQVFFSGDCRMHDLSGASGMHT